jgi:hypothetical protein
VLQNSFFGDQIGLGRLEAFFVNQLVEIGPRQFVELGLNRRELFGDLRRGGFNGFAAVCRVLVDEVADKGGFLWRDSERGQNFGALVGNGSFLHVSFGAVAFLSRASVVAVKAAVPLGPLSRDHRVAGAAKETAKRKVVPFARLPRLAPNFESRADFREQVRGNERLEFSFKRLAAPNHDAHV